MAWTRQGQIGAEHNDVAEWFLDGTTQPDISSGKARTGTYAVRYTSSTHPVGKLFTAAVQTRAGVWLNHVGMRINSSYRAYIFKWGASIDGVRWNSYANLLELVVGGSVVDSISDTTGSFSSVDQWYHCGVIVESHASTGWVSFYLDGIKILSTTGANTGADLDAMYFGGAAGSGWNSYAYFDDFFVDTSDGSEVDVFVPFLRFGWRIANGNGTNSEWTGSDADQTDNYLQVDDVTPDDETTYNYVGVTGQQDSYATTSYAVPEGYTQVAEIASVLARKTGSGEQLKVGFTDGANQSLSAAQDLSADYRVIFSRHTTQPDASAWNETDGDAMEVLVESAGTYS